MQFVCKGTAKNGNGVIISSNFLIFSCNFFLTCLKRHFVRIKCLLIFVKCHFIFVKRLFILVKCHFSVANRLFMDPSWGIGHLSQYVYVEQLFWIHIGIIAEDLGIPRLEKNEEEV